MEQCQPATAGSAKSNRVLASSDVLRRVMRFIIRHANRAFRVARRSLWPFLIGAEGCRRVVVRAPAIVEAVGTVFPVRGFATLAIYK